MPTLTELLTGMSSPDATTAFQSYDQLPAVNAPNPFTSPGEMRPYNPTWRDRIAAALMGDMPANSPRGRGVEALMGSGGLGQRGMGAVDLTPFGIPLAVQETHRAGMAGDYMGAALAGLGILPAARPVGAAATGIRAYHGSPHKFDAFSMSKIGTGEGAQAYGNGLYFAGNEDVAQHYRQVLERRNITAALDGKPITSWPTTLQSIPDEQWPLRKILDEYGRLGGDPADFIKQQRNWYRGDKQMNAGIDDFEKRVTASFTPGSMYEVNINADPARMLDWDRKLGDQSPFVSGVGAQYGWRPHETGQDFYAFLSNGDAVKSAEKLKEAGIPGIKYLDEGSRGMPASGTHNYVVFDDKLIDILRRYGLGGVMVGGAAAAGAAGVSDPRKRIEDVFSNAY